MTSTWPSLPVRWVTTSPWSRTTRHISVACVDCGLRTGRRLPRPDRGAVFTLPLGRDLAGPLSVRPIPVGQTVDALLEHHLRLPAQQSAGLLDIRPCGRHVG